MVSSEPEPSGLAERREPRSKQSPDRTKKSSRMGGEKLILRLPNSETRVQFESALAAIGESIADFQVILEVDNVATIKDLIRKNLGISILARSACMDELRKGKFTALPIENLSMTRETNLVYHQDFAHKETLQDILALYKKQLREYGRA